MAKLEELNAAFALATPGEWNNTEQSNGLNSVYGNCQFDSMADADLIAFDIQNGDDAEFITLAHELMPQLLKAVSVLKAVRARVSGEFDCPELVEMGHLSGTLTDILRFCDTALEPLK